MKSLESPCSVCGVLVPQSLGRGRPRRRCDDCWEALVQGSHRTDLGRPCHECHAPAEYRRSYCADHPTKALAQPRLCPCGQSAAAPSWYCSPECRTEARRESNRRRSTQPARRKSERARQRTRAQAKNAEDKPYRRPEWVHTRKLVLADHPPCGICGDSIDYALKFPDPMSPSVDHIVSWRRGGAWFDLTNLRAAHFGCNAGRREDVAS